MDRKNAGELQEHMLGTYYSLRVGLVILGIALPLVLVLARSLACGMGVAGSISVYYYPPPDCVTQFFTTRDLFVGGLFATAACLYLYKGYSTRENVALNLAGGFLVLVALLPTAAPSTPRGTVAYLHAASAVLFFLCIAYVSFCRSRDTLPLLPPARQARYAQLYTITGWALFVSPLVALVTAAMLDRKAGTIVFWVETFAVLAFAAYWFIKTFEMRETTAEKRGLDAQLQRAMIPATPPPVKAAAAHADVGVMVAAPDRPAGAGEVERIVPADWPVAPQPVVPVPVRP